MKSFKKKGAISFFIIAGVALFMIFALMFAFSDRGQYYFDKDVLPDRLKQHPVEMLVDGCVEDIVREGVSTLGMHAGYLDYAGDKGLDPIVSSGAYMASSFVPYWYHIDRSNKFSSERPPLCESGCDFSGSGSIEEQLTIYINENLDNCINNFKSLENQFKIEKETFVTKVIIRDNDIQVNLAYPMDVKSKSTGNVQSLRNFNTRVDVPLKEMYELALEIVEAEQQTGFIEDHIIYMISLYSGIDEPLPPMSGLKIGNNNFKTWPRVDVEKVVKNDILDLVRLLQIVNTANFNPIYLGDNSEAGKIRQGVYNSMSIRTSENIYDELEVDFIYPGTSIDLSIGDSELIFPENKLPIKNFVLDWMGFSIYDYGFNYDVSFPIIITLTRKDPLGDLKFRFAVEGNVKNNLPVTSDFDLRASTIPSNSLNFMDQSQRVDKDILVGTKDVLSGDVLSGVDLFYSCGNKAYIGRTINGIINEKMPFCLFGGKILAEKENYYANPIYYDNHDDGNANVKFDIDMYPVKEIEYELRIIDEGAFESLSNGVNPLLDFGKLLYDNSKEFTLDRRVVLSIENSDGKSVPPIFINYKKEVKLNNSNNTVEMNPVLTLKKEIERQFINDEITLEERDSFLVDLESLESSDLIIDENNVITLVPGNYNYEAYLVYEDEMIIPSKVEKFCPCTEVLGVCACGVEEIVYPEQKFDAFPIGGASSNVEVGMGLYYADKIVFYVFETSLPKSWVDLENYRQLDYYKDHGYLLKPTFVGAK